MIEVKALFFSVFSMLIMIIEVAVGEEAGWWDREIWENGKEGEV